MKERIQYIDTAKCLGIFAIYLGHIAAAGSRLQSFIFIYQVPLFFFLSGAMKRYVEIRDAQREQFGEKKGTVLEKFCKDIRKAGKKILGPWLLFAVISIGVAVLYLELERDHVAEYLFQIFQGTIRNQFFNQSLWFLTCLFVVEMIFGLIQSCKYKSAIFFLCIGLFLISEYGLGFRPIIEPKWIWNVDSAMYYIIYYYLGFIMFPWVDCLITGRGYDTLLKRTFRQAIFSLGGYSVALFFGRDLMISLYNVYILGWFYEVFRAVIIIIVSLFLGWLLQDIDVFQKLGKNSIYMCGNEYIASVLMISITSIFGLKIFLTNPLMEFLYAILLLCIVNKYLRPVEEAILKRIVYQQE